MEQKNSFIGGFPNPNLDEAQLQDALQKMLQQTAQNGAPALGLVAQIQQRRAARLETAASALGKELGPDHPDVVALQNTVQAVARFNVKLDRQNERLKTWPKTRPNEWLVFGTVLAADHTPVSGAIVRVYDRDRKYDDLLGETETGANGDFSVIYHERDFKETGEARPDLYVMVSDAQGKLLYSSRDSIRFEAGQAEYFAIQLGEASPNTAPKPVKATRTAPRASRKKS
jgi:hypothetical protein